MQLLVKDKKTFPATYWLLELGLTAADLLGSGVRKCVEKATFYFGFEKVLSARSKVDMIDFFPFF